jgi:hypothetical protein
VAGAHPLHERACSKFNLLHQEGKGLNVALSCLNYGRCTLSAGMLGGAITAMDQAIKWSQTRYQFQRPLADFELVRQKIAHMAALCYAMDAMLYMTTGMLDHHDEDIMVETAICKMFCSEFGWQVVNDAMQIMGGEGYMTENELERIFRDSRINLIVEGANEVMQSFVFAYGGKQLAEQMLGVQELVGWDNDQSFVGNLARITKNMLRPTVAKAAVPLAMELFLGMKRGAPVIERVHPSLHANAERLAELVRDFSHQFKMASKRYREKIVDRQSPQARLADAAMWLHAWACVLSKLDLQLRRGDSGQKFERDRTAAMHFIDICQNQIRVKMRELFDNVDDSMLAAADQALKLTESLPNNQFVIPERSPVARGTGKRPKQDGIKQFPGDKHLHDAPEEEAKSYDRQEVTADAK